MTPPDKLTLEEVEDDIKHQRECGDDEDYVNVLEQLADTMRENERLKSDLAEVMQFKRITKDWVNPHKHTDDKCPHGFPRAMNCSECYIPPTTT